MRKDVRSFAGKLMRAISNGVATDRTREDSGAVAETTGNEDGETGDITRPLSDAGSNPWNDVGPGPSQPLVKRGRRLSYDLATGVMNLPDDDGWISPGADEDSDEEIQNPSGSGTPASGEGEGPEISEGNGDRKVIRRQSTYWHHPDRKRISGSLAP